MAQSKRTSSCGGLMTEKLMQGDCLTLLERVEDHSIDMILADLPYGMTDNKWDSVIPLQPLLNNMNE